MGPRNLRPGWYWRLLQTILGLVIVLLPAVSIATDSLYVDDNNGNSPYTVNTDINFFNEIIGLSSSGTLDHYSATNTVDNTLILGFANGSFGIYNLIGGSLSAPGQYIGYEGGGLFFQVGGANALSSDGVTINLPLDSRGRLSLHKNSFMFLVPARLRAMNFAPL